MTRIGSLVLKISTLILFSITAAASDVAPYPRYRKPQPKLDPNASCQLEMESLLPIIEPTPELNGVHQPALSDLTLMQGQMFDYFAKADYEKGEPLRRRLENFLYTTRLAKQPDAYLNSHELYKVTAVSYVVLRDQPAGGKETAAYETVKALGYPIQMPVTVAHGNRGGSLQIFHGYPNPPPKKDGETQNMHIDMLNGELRREIQHEIAQDPDVFLVDFLTLNKGRYAENVVYEKTRKNPLIPYDWDAAFMAGPLANFEFFDLARSWYNVPDLTADSEGSNDYYKAAKAILREQIARSKFNWKRALDTLNESRVENLIDTLKMRLQDYQAALQVRGQICALRAAIYDGDLSACRKLGFNLTKADTMRNPLYRQHDREQ